MKVAPRKRSAARDNGSQRISSFHIDVPRHEIGKRILGIAPRVITQKPASVHHLHLPINVRRKEETTDNFEDLALDKVARAFHRLCRRAAQVDCGFMKPSLFSVSYAGLWGQAHLTLPAFVDRAKTLGYQGVMLMGKRPHASILDLDEGRRRALREHLRQAGLEVVCLAGYTSFTAGLECPEVPLMELQVKYVEELAKLTRDLGCRLVRVFTGYESNGHSPTMLWNRCIEALRWCSDVAQHYEVTLGIQNHHDLGVDTDALLEMLQDIGRPNVKLMFDAWSPALRGEDLYQAARKAAPFTVASTCADYVRLRRHAYVADLVNYRPLQPELVRAVPMGEGFIDYRAFFRGLRDGGFDGWVNYEMCSPLRGGGDEKNLDACARRFLDYFRTSILTVERDKL